MVLLRPRRFFPPRCLLRSQCRRPLSNTTTATVTPTNSPSKNDNDHANTALKNQLERPKPFYITTPIFYPNASPHIGHLYSLATADVLARFQRLKGRETRFLAGTDEHGMKIQKASRVFFNGEAGREKEFCDMLSERFRDLGKRASISNTCFMRTSSEEHHKAVEHVWRNLADKGYIYKSHYSGYYSITDETFYTASQVQDGVSLETGAAVEWTEEENYMFRLSAFRDALLQHYTKHPGSVYPRQYHEMVLGMLGGAPLHLPSGENDSEPEAATIEDFVLSDISISRPRSRLEWGVQVPGDSEQTVYVWFDALLIYLTGAGYPWLSSLTSSSLTPTPTMAVDTLEGIKKGWPADIQVIGKDILRFHAIYFPAILLALASGPYVPPGTPVTCPAPSTPAASVALEKIPISLPGTLLTHAHWTSSQKKMSKSLGNVADPIEAMEKWGVDVVRFYMMRVGGRWRDDVDWSTEQLDKHHKEIQSQLGNYFLRITSPRLAERAASALPGLEAHSGLPSSIQALFLQNKTYDANATETETDKLNAELLREVLLLPAKVEKQLDALEAGNALAEIMGVLKLANKNLTDIAPWAPTTVPLDIHTTRLVALETLRTVGLCLRSFMPTVSGRLLEALGVAEGVSVTGEEREGERYMEVIWERWNGKEVKGVKLF